MTDVVKCLACGESQAAIRASQRTNEPIFCAAVDYFGECDWTRDRHIFVTPKQKGSADAVDS
jgi:hypothetical protein